jgi:hypothetical protein
LTAREKKARELESEVKGQEVDAVCAIATKETRRRGGKDQKGLARAVKEQ